MDELLVFQSFANKNEATRVAAMLESKGIIVSVEENISQLDSNFIGQQFDNPYCVKIPGASFVEANNILLEDTVIDLDEVDKDYMLLSFTDLELTDVMLHKEEWGVYNYKLAEALLASRAIQIPKQRLEDAEAQSRVEEAKPTKYDGYWIALGYVFALISFYVFYTDFGWFIFTFPSLFGLVVGFLLFFSKKTLTTGKRVWTYDKSSRIHGLLIFLLAIVIAILKYEFISLGIYRF